MIGLPGMKPALHTPAPRALVRRPPARPQRLRLGSLAPRPASGPAHGRPARTRSAATRQCSTTPPRDPRPPPHRLTRTRLREASRRRARTRARRPTSPMRSQVRRETFLGCAGSADAPFAARPALWRGYALPRRAEELPRRARSSRGEVYEVLSGDSGRH